MKISTRVEAAGLLAKLKKNEKDFLLVVRPVVARNLKELEAEVERLVGKAFSGGSKRAGASRAGQPPRKRTGRLQSSIQRQVTGDGTRGVVTVNADDGKGNRYPFMLESGTKTVAKRPFVKKAQRNQKKKFSRDLLNAIRQVT